MLNESLKCNQYFKLMNVKTRLYIVAGLNLLSHM
jgi:hypothetical protein